MLERIRRNPTLVFVPLGAGVSIILFLVFRREIWGVFSSPERIEQAVNSWGLWAPLAFVLVQFIQVVVFVIPGEIPQIAGGYLFGLAPATIYSITGILLGSSFNFMLARLFGVPFVRTLFKEGRIRSFDGITHSPRAQIAFFLLFVIPGIPKDVLCYIAGLSPLRFGVFLLISTIGRIPGILGSAAMGSAAASREWLFALLLMLFSAVLFVLGLVFREKIHGVIERYALKPTGDLRNRQSREPGRADEEQDT